MHGGNKAILGFWNEARKTNAVIDTGLRGGDTLVMEINVTDAVLLTGFDITVTYDPAIIRATKVNASGTGCPRAEGCVFDGINLLELLKSVDTPTGTTRYAIAILDPLEPHAAGTGTVFRITFSIVAEGSSLINIREEVSIIVNPGQIPYEGVDGFVATATPEYNYSVSNPGTLTINRPVAGTQSGSVSVTVTLITGTTRPTSLKLLGLPGRGVTASITPSSGSPTFTATISITVNGGVAGGSTTAPSGTYAIVIAGNATVAAGHLVKTGWLTLRILPPPAPVYTISASPVSASVEQGSFVLVNINHALTSGTPEPVLLDANIEQQVLGGSEKFNPPNPTMCSPAPCSGLLTVMNISVTFTTSPGIYKFNITATSTGLYSETAVVRKIVDYTLTVTLSPEVHDVAVGQLTFPKVAGTNIDKNFAYDGVTPSDLLLINVEVVNQGTRSESTTVSLTAVNATHSVPLRDLTGSCTVCPVSVAPRDTVVVQFKWPDGMKRSPFDRTVTPNRYVPYTLSVQVATVTGETDTADNSRSNAGTFTVRLKGDVNADGAVNIIDLTAAGTTIGKFEGVSGYALDLNGDTILDSTADIDNAFGINAIDLVTIAANIGALA